MPLPHYGVLVGTLTSHTRDTPDDQGKWFHVKLKVQAPLGAYQCAVDVDSKQSATGVQWKVLTVAPGMFGPVSGLAAGYHELQRDQASGALDLIRHPELIDRPGCLFIVRPPEWLQRLIDVFVRRTPWTSGSHLDATVALESILVPGAKTLVWGEPFNNGLGMHNIHQNQGDPSGSQWWAQNGIWQDGGTVTLRPDGMLQAFISKFSTQAATTDAAGHPA
jgi:hypothetical protein